MLNSIKLYNGYEVPIIGLGTWQSQSNELKLAIEKAISVGYRYFDTAWIYGNEKEIGEAIKKVIKSGTVKRKELFITSKLWNSFHRPEMVQKGIQETLSNLNLDYLDLYLIHWPIAVKPGNKRPSKSKFKDEIDDVDLAKTWREMEKLVDSGKVKSIGVSNFNIKQLQYLLDNCRIKPAVSQVELHVYLPNKKLHDFCSKHDIRLTAYSPLGGDFSRPSEEPKPLNDDKVLEIAKKLKATAGQILISYIIHKGIICIPKSISPIRLAENFKAVDVQLSEEDFMILDNLNVNIRKCDPKVFRLHKNYPFYED